MLQVKCAGTYRECSFYDPRKPWSSEVNPVFQDLLAQSARINPALHIPTSRESVLYVFEGEIAQNVSEEAFDYVASDDATTCHILVAIYQLKNESKKRILICHIASVENCSCLVDYLDQIATNCHGNIVHIYLV